MFIEQSKGKMYDKLPRSKVPRGDSEWYQSVKLDGVYVQIHIDKKKQLVRFFTSGGKEFFVEQSAMQFLKVAREITSDTIILEAEYTYNCEGVLGDRTNSAKLTTYRTQFNRGDATKGNEKDTFNVFDIIDTNKTFVERLYLLSLLVDHYTNIKLVKHNLVDYREAHMITRELAREGWEGSMLKHPQHMQIEGKRQNTNIKIKYRPEMFCKVIREIEGEGRLTGMIGALECVSPYGHTFKVGSGFSDGERTLWDQYKSKHIEIEYEQLMNGVPQQPTFKRLLGGM